MQLKSVLLALLLALQLGLIFYLNKTETTNKDLKIQFISERDIEKVDVVELASSNTEEKSIRFRKKGEGSWVQETYFNTPVSSELEEILDIVSKPISSLAVGTTSIAAKNFEVTKENYQKKLIFTSSLDKDFKSNIYIGKSPIYKNTYVRAENSDSTYLMPIASGKLSLKPEDWLEKDLLSVKKDEIKQIKINCIKEEVSQPEIVLIRENNKFLIKDLSITQETNYSVLDGMLSKLDILYVDKLLSQKEAIIKYHEKSPTRSLNSPDCLIDITKNDTKKIILRLSYLGDKSVLVNSNSLSYVYGLTNIGNLKPLMESSLNSLISIKNEGVLKNSAINKNLKDKNIEITEDVDFNSQNSK